MGARFRITNLNLMLYYVIVFINALVNETDAFYLFDKYLRTAVKNRHFRCVKFYKTVVNSGSIEGRKSVLDSRNPYIAFCNHSAATGFNNILSKSVNHRFAGKIDTLKLISVVLGCRIEGGFYLKAGMKTFPFDGELTAECLLHHGRCGILRIGL